MSEEEKEALQKKNKTRQDKLTPMDQLVAKMEVVLSNPEDIIIKQGDCSHVFLKETHKENHNQSSTKKTEIQINPKNIKMYLVAKGKLEVTQSSGKVSESENFIRRLSDNDHFGEISLLYDCKRTCNVISSNYCTLATISKPDY